jgi:dTDP-4-dehydrorhamnose reductase
VAGFQNAYFSGLTTLEVAKVIEKIIFSNKNLSGIFHLSSERISKYELLGLISDIYFKKIEIVPTSLPVIDRSLNSEKLKILIDYKTPSWKEMIFELKNFYKCETSRIL